MADLKPAYLVCGDDDAKIDAWRARVRRRAEEERGPGGLDAFDARAAEPAEVVAALTALTFDPGTRYAYSGEGINLLQFVLETGVGLDVGREMQRRVFDRFGMKRTSMTWRGSSP